MAKIHLIPCKLRADRLVPVKEGEVLVLTPTELMKKFRMDPANRLHQATMKLLSPLSYIGLTQHVLRPKEVTHFYLKNLDLSNDVEWIQKKNPTWSERLQEVWMVDKVEWDAQVVREGASTGAHQVW
jgi:hypothetical protein